MRAGRTTGAALAALVLLHAPRAIAQGACGAPVPASATHRAWPAPLDRTVSFRARDVSLREALDRLSAAARVQLSYSSDLLPLARRVCVTARDEPLGAALARLLAGTGVEATVVAGQVVLAPARSGATAAADGHVQDRVNALDAIVVTGSPVGTARRGVTVGLEVVEGRRLSRRGAESLPDVLNAAVPGVWAWRQSPSALVAQYASVRGASSFGATYPKVYVDGVEAANPLLVTEIDPDDVERVEVIRGPQGAALYGSDAISGVINIVTRHEGSGGAGPRTEIRSSAGVAGSSFAAHQPSTWEHRLALRTGSNLGSAGLSLKVGRTGAIFPGADTRRIAAVADARRVLRSAILNASLRVSDRRSGVGENPLLDGLAPAFPALDSTDAEGQSVRLYTLATSATIATNGPWTHTLLFGVDGYRLDYVPESVVALPQAADSVLRAARGGGDRGTFRASSTLRLGEASATAGSFTVAVEHSLLHQRTLVSSSEPVTSSPGQPMPRYTRMVEGTDSTVAEWRHDSGMMAQVSLSWRNALFGTAGVRFESSGGFAGGTELSTLPMVGAAWVQRIGGAELKLRSAYGRGIRPPRTPARDHLSWHDRWDLTLLEPEVQSGIEMGAELYLGAGSLQVTRFDQRASGLIQDVAVGVDTFVQGMRDVRRVRYDLQNVGAIDNRGWEMQGAVASGPLSLSGTLALVDSRVRRLAVGYLGDLRQGDRVLGVPGRSASLTAEWEGRGWSGALTATRAWDWINYDRLALAREFAADTTGMRAFSGPRLRDFWRAYDGATDLRATVSRLVRPGIWLVAKGENLLGTQVGEPDNLTIRAGRSLMLGAKASF